MSIADDRRDWYRAYELGASVGRNGGKPESCPYRRGTNDLLRERRMEGYEAGRAERRRR